MPYIHPTRREELDPTAHLAFYAQNVGDLTFQLTALVLRYLGDAPRFADYAAAVAALECSKLELYRRSVAPHEDFAVARNGDLPYPGAS